MDSSRLKNSGRKSSPGRGLPALAELDDWGLKYPVPKFAKDGYNLAERATITSEYGQRWQAPADIPGFESSPGKKKPNIWNAWSVEKFSIPRSFAIWKSKTPRNQKLPRMTHETGVVVPISLVAYFTVRSPELADAAVVRREAVHA